LIDLFIVLNATFSNISVISWRPVLVMEKYSERTTDHGQATDKLFPLQHPFLAHLTRRVL
jgi:hypothetical protein